MSIYNFLILQNNLVSTLLTLISFLVAIILFILKGEKLKPLIAVLTNVGIVISVLLFIFLNMKASFFPDLNEGKACAVTFENRTAIHPLGVWFNSNYAIIPVSTTLKGALHIITENPKVRNFVYEIEAKINEPELYFKNHPEQKLIKNLNLSQTKISSLVNYWICEFNNSNSKILAKYYNNYDTDQYYEVKNLIEGYFNNKLLYEGIHISFKGFYME